MLYPVFIGLYVYIYTLVISGLSMLCPVFIGLYYTKLQATGTRLGSLIETIFGMLTAVAVALAASWLLTFVVLSFVPLLVIAGE